MVYKIEFYAYLPKLYIYFLLHFESRSDPEPNPDPNLEPVFFLQSSRIRIHEKILDSHPWKHITVSYHDTIVWEEFICTYSYIYKILLYCISKKSWPIYIVTYFIKWVKTSWVYSSFYCCTV